MADRKIHFVTVAVIRHRRWNVSSPYNTNLIYSNKVQYDSMASKHLQNDKKRIGDIFLLLFILILCTFVHINDNLSWKIISSRGREVPMISFMIN